MLLTGSLNCYAQNSNSGNGKDMPVLDIDDPSIIEGTSLGTVKFREKIFSSNCSYNEVIANLKAEALEKGGNLMRITMHKKPDILSTCHRIVAEVYKVADPHVFEKKFSWSATRKLTAADFKGVPDKEEAEITAAATYCGITFETNRVTLYKNPKFFVSCVFDCYQSWMKSEYKDNKEVLEHEQTHFDLGEVYTRKLLQALQNEGMTMFDLEKKSTEIYQRIFDEYKKRQEQYDNETVHGTIKEKQTEWNKKVAAELAALAAYSRE